MSGTGPAPCRSEPCSGGQRPCGSSGQPSRDAPDDAAAPEADGAAVPSGRHARTSPDGGDGEAGSAGSSAAPAKLQRMGQEQHRLIRTIPDRQLEPSPAVPRGIRGVVQHAKAEQGAEEVLRPSIRPVSRVREVAAGEPPASQPLEHDVDRTQNSEAAAIDAGECKARTGRSSVPGPVVCAAIEFAELAATGGCSDVPGSVDQSAATADGSGVPTSVNDAAIEFPEFAQSAATAGGSGVQLQSTTPRSIANSPILSNCR